MRFSKFGHLICFICGLVLLSSLSLPASGETKKLRVRGSNNYPPFEYISHSGKPEGFNVDIIRALMQELGYDYELQLSDNWDKVIEDLQNNEIDVIIGMIYSPERAQTMQFSLPTCVINRNFITRQSDHYNSFNDLKGKEIIVEKGGWFHNYLLKNNITDKIIETSDIYESLKLFQSGSHDAILASERVAQYAIKQLGIKGLKIEELDIEPQNYTIAVNQDNDKLLYKLNIGLQQLKISGTYDQIYNKWFGIYESRRNRTPFIIALSVFLFIASTLILFVRLLRKQVKQSTRMLDNSRQEMAMAIDAGNISAWTYQIPTGVISSLHGKSLGGSGSSIEYIYEKIHPEDVKRVAGEFETLSAGRKQSGMISFRMRENSRFPYLHMEAKMLYVKATKDYPERIIGTLKDVTKDVNMRQELEDYQLKTEFIVKTNDIILVQYDILNHVFIRINEDKYKERVVYTMEQYLAMIHPEDMETGKRFVAELNRGELQQLETEFRIASEDGTYEWYIVTATACKYDNRGKITEYMGLRRNNTKWKAINNDLIVLREKADASNRLKSAFLANMSHEIRTPLNAIVGFSELITETEDKEERETYIDIVKTNNKLLLQLINDVLDLSRIEAGYINFSYAAFDFSAYFKELALTLKLRDTENVSLEYNNRYDNLMIYSDRNRISQVITNFVTNAFKFTKQGTITLDYTYEHEGIKVSVTDTGIGIGQENQPRIFERFEKINDFAQGTGLGLPICKAIIEALQGEIGVKSEPGAGSTFWFWLPCNAGMNMEDTEESPVQGISIADISKMRTAGDVSDNQNKKTILIAEDIDNNYYIISTVIKNDFNIIRAVNGAEAVEKTRLHNPDIILMDMKMPMMDGIEATKEIRKFNATVPIIALTAYVFDTNKQDAFRAGCNNFLAKPVNRSILMEMLDSYK